MRARCFSNRWVLPGDESPLFVLSCSGLALLLVPPLQIDTHFYQIRLPL